MFMAVAPLDAIGAPEARKLFGAKKAPADLRSRAIGSYARGCLAGGAMLPVNGTAWQAMRLSRNRNWGHPALVKYVERLATESKEVDGWPGLLVGDLSQPRGGPMLTGHRSHQIGLDADIWLKPMPNRRLTRKEREKISAISMLGKDRLSINKRAWKPGHVTLLKRAASSREVARIFVHPVIKKELCRAAGNDRRWLNKIRPWWGHHYHFHVRLSCPRGMRGCVNQKPAPGGDGCGKQLDDWFKLLKRAMKPKKKPPPKITKPKKKPKKRRRLRLADLPADCKLVLNAHDVPSSDLVPASQRPPATGWVKRQGGISLPDRKPK